MRRAPLYLRAVLRPRAQGMAPERDVLDLLEDFPRHDETISVYRRVGEATSVHIRGSRSVTGFYAMAEYEFLPDVIGELLRDNDVWQTWCRERAAA